MKKLLDGIERLGVCGSGRQSGAGRAASMNHARILCPARRRCRNVGHLFAMVCLGPPELECVNNTTTFARRAPPHDAQILLSIFISGFERIPTQMHSGTIK